ncbi:protein of unknown function [Pararobbsia alpina]
MAFHVGRMRGPLRDALRRSAREALFWLPTLMPSLHAVAEHVRSASHRAHAPRTPSPRHPAVQHAAHAAAPQQLSALQLEQGVVTLPLSASKADRPIQIPFEVPPGKVFLVAALSGGTGGAILSIQRPDGTSLAAAERAGLDNGTYKLYAFDLRTAGPGEASSLVAQISVTPGTKGFRNVKLAIKAAGFGVTRE